MEPKDKSSEIEITPAMIEAGVKELSAFDRRFDFEADCVERIFRRMCAARLSPGASKQ